MAWQLTSDLDEFTGTAGEFLASRPVEHTVLLTLVETLRRRGPHAYGPGDPIFGSWLPSAGPVGGVLLQTPPHPMILTAMPAEAVPAAAAALAGHPLTGVNLPAGLVDAFVAAWAAPAQVGVRTRLYRLGELTPPTPMPPGAARSAGPGDQELVVRWMSAFFADIGEGHPASPAPPDDVTLWTADGVPVGAGHPVPPGQRHGPDPARLHPARAPAPRLRRRGHHGRRPGRSGRGRHRGRAQRRPGQPDQQRAVPPAGFPAGRGPHCGGVRVMTNGMVFSVNIAATATARTGIDKHPVDHPVSVRAPGPAKSGLIGDRIGNGKLHGGDDQAVYAYAREDYDWWQAELGRDLRGGFYGET